MESGAEKRGNVDIESAVDTILKECSKFDEDRQRWFFERQELTDKITDLSDEVKAGERRFELLSKRYRILQMSLRHLSNENEKQRQMDGSDDVFGLPKPADKVDESKSTKEKPITISLKKKSKKVRHVWSATLPSSLDSPKMFKLINDLQRQWQLSTMSGDSKPELNSAAQPSADPNPKANDTHNANKPPKSDSNTESLNTTADEPQLSTQSDFATKPNNNSNAMTQPQTNNDFKLKSLQCFKGHLDVVRTLCFHSLENVLVSGADDSMVKIWRIGNKETHSDNISPLMTLRGHRGIITSSVLMESGNLLVTADENGSLFGWNLETIISSTDKDDSPPNLSSLFEMRRFAQESVHSDVIWDLLPHPIETEPLIATLSADNCVKLFNFEKQECVQRFQMDPSMPGTISCGLWNDENDIIVGMTSGSVAILDSKSGDIIHSVEMPQRSNINAIAQSNRVHTNTAFLACDDGKVRMLDLRKMQCVNSVQAHTDSVTSLCINSDTASLLTASHDARVRVWQMDSFTIAQDIEPQHTHRLKWDEGIVTIRYDSQSQFGATGGADGNIILFSAM